MAVDELRREAALFEPGRDVEVERPVGRKEINAATRNHPHLCEHRARGALRGREQPGEFGADVIFITAETEAEHAAGGEDALHAGEKFRSVEAVE